MIDPESEIRLLKAKAEAIYDPFRHVRKHEHLNGAFGNDSFGQIAERIARFLGTPKFIIGQTLVVLIWISFNIFIFLHHWDPYPFILLNLMFSTQAAYASPFILLASTRQADRDKSQAEADAKHREEVAAIQASMLKQNTDITVEMQDLLRQNTDQTVIIASQTAQLDEIHRHLTAIMPDAGKFPPPGMPS